MLMSPTSPRRFRPPAEFDFSHVRKAAPEARAQKNGAAEQAAPFESSSLDQKILTALSNVFQTPQASGTPTKAQNSAALTSKPPLPMPNEPCWTADSFLARVAWYFATSSALMFHLSSTGLIRKLQIRPASSMAQRIYIVV